MGLRSAGRLLALAALLAAPSTALAGSGSSLPPDVDLDPDRGMSFGRLPKTSFDRRVFDPMKKSLNSQVMDPSVDPWSPAVRPSRYEPGTGKIRDSYSDKVRQLRRDEEARRKTRTVERDDGKASYGAYKPQKPSRPERSGLSTQRKSDD